ncbi:hypothetical protein QQF64_028048 [Cirrhinus molitorella]|uniref:Uncharacterized protein n=1 Tax=Cirrhinus molitorella TaxID=172907 RepID=A0ABR3N5N6_9TELE
MLMNADIEDALGSNLTLRIEPVRRAIRVRLGSRTIFRVCRSRFPDSKIGSFGSALTRTEKRLCSLLRMLYLVLRRNTLAAGRLKAAPLFTPLW